ncbi:MAG: hypothetical protein KDC83_15845, partial [Flavobacteriales bacterium]|nr:hypothetical protein [Flavobacteriales bacterium]
HKNQMLIHNTNRVNGTAMPQKLENGGEINKTEKLNRENVRKGKTKINFSTKNETFTNKTS